MIEIKKVPTSRPSAEVMEAIRLRDTKCVYCGVEMLLQWDKMNQDKSPTLEHLNHRQDWDSVGSYVREGKPVVEIVAMCCGDCNSSRGAKSLREWFETPYCVKRKISALTVADVVQQYLERYEQD